MPSQIAQCLQFISLAAFPGSVSKWPYLERHVKQATVFVTYLFWLVLLSGAAFLKVQLVFSPPLCLWDFYA